MDLLNSAFDLNGAMMAAEHGDIEAWVLAYLEGPGKNQAFADGLRLESRRWRGPIEVELLCLERTCGPESSMPFHTPEHVWVEYTGQIAESFRSLEDFPPLIVQSEPEHLYVRDGNHRYGAFEQISLRSCWAIIWYANDADYQDHQSRGFSCDT